MVRNSRTFVDSLLPVSTVEQRRALAAFALFATFMASYYLVKPVRESLYVHFVGADRLAEVYLASVGVSLIATVLYNVAFVRVTLRRLFQGTIGAMSFITIAFWVSASRHWISEQTLATSFFLWVSLYGTVCATLFWSIANDVFDLNTGRIVYGFIGLGGLCGGIVGSLLTEQIVHRHVLVTENLLPLASVLLIATLPQIHYLMRKRPTENADANAGDAQTTLMFRPRQSGWHTLLNDRYVGALALLVSIMTFAGTLLVLPYNHVLQHDLAGKEEKTAFLGTLYTITNLLAVFIQVSITGRVQRRFGPVPGLMPLPLIGIVGISTLYLVPRLGAVMIPWALGLALLYSINQASKELLYIPTSREVKYGAKAYIDVFFYRLGDGIASLLFILYPTLTQTSNNPALMIMGVFVIGVWLLLIVRLGRGYRARTAANDPDSSRSMVMVSADEAT